MKEYEKKEQNYWEVMSKRYNRDYHNSIISESQDSDFAVYVSSHYNEGDRILDIGCGPASLWAFWKENLRNPMEMIGVDISEDNIQICRNMYKEDRFITGSIFDIPLETGSIDIIIASSILHHIPDDSLPDAFKELNRVLDEHGILIGREPANTGRLGDIPGWLTGALMSFRHMVYRKTHTREYPEPILGEHHHAFDPEEFITLLKQYFMPKGIEFRFPVSSYVARCNNVLVKKVVGMLDKSLNHAGGHQFYYLAKKNYYDMEDISNCIQQDLKANTSYNFDSPEFLALLYKAAELIDSAIKDDEK